MTVYKTKYDGNIFKKCRINSGLSQKEAAKILDIVPSTISKWESGSTLPDQSILPNVADLYKVSVDYLLGREEEPNLINGHIPDGIVYFPVIGSVRAGYNGSIQEYDTGEFVPIPMEFLHGRRPNEYILFEIKGSSMSPMYEDGERVLVLRTDSVDSGTIAVVAYNSDEATVKKVKYTPGENWLELIPLNPTYSTMRIEGADLEQCRIIGKVMLSVKCDNMNNAQHAQIEDEYSQIADEARTLGVPPEDLAKIVELYRKYVK